MSSRCATGRRVRCRIVLKDVFIGRCSQTPRQTFDVERPRVRGTRQRPLRTGQHQIVNLFRGQTQGSFSENDIRMLSRFNHQIAPVFRHSGINWMSDGGRRLHRQRAKSTIVKLESKIARVLRVTELFHSIQGESTHAGRPCKRGTR